MLTSCSLPSLIWIKLGILPRTSSSVCTFTAAFVVRKRRPRKQRERQVDSGGVQSVRGVHQVDAKGFVDVQLAGNADQALREVCVDTPVPCGVCIGQRMRSCANAMHRHWPMHVKLGTLRLPLYRATQRSNTIGGKCPMSCAKISFPVCCTGAIRSPCY